MTDCRLYLELQNVQMTGAYKEREILAEIDSGARRFVIDLSQLDYISSSGLRVILLAAKRLNSTAGKLVLCCLTDNVRQVFELAGFLSLFRFYGSRDEAINNI